MKKYISIIVTMALILVSMNGLVLADDETETETTVVAVIGDTEYSTLAEAVDACGTDTAIIQLVSDVTEHVEIPSGADITLDLNGYTLTSASGAGTYTPDRATIYVL